MEILVNLFAALKQHQLEDEMRSDYEGHTDAFFSPLRQEKCYEAVRGRPVSCFISLLRSKQSFFLQMGPWKRSPCNKTTSRQLTVQWMYLTPAHNSVVLVLAPNRSSEHTPFTPDVVTKVISIHLFEIPPWSGQKASETHLFA
jgi:hypothetical protein